MNEYKVKIKITYAGFLFYKEFYCIEIIKADSYSDAQKKAQEMINTQSFQLADNNSIAIIENIEKL